MRPPGLRGQGQRPGAALRGQPGASRVKGPQLRQGSGHAQPDVRPGAHPPSPPASRRPGRRQVGTGDLGRGPGRHRRTDRAGAGRRPSRRDHVPRGPPGRGRLRGAHPPGLGGGRAQQPHQHLLVGGPHRLRHVDGLRPSVRRLRQRPVHPPAVRPAGVRPLLQSPRPAHHRGPPHRGQVGDHRSPAVQHRLHVRLLAVALAGHRAGHAAGDSGSPARMGRRRSRLHAPLGQLGGVPGGAGAGSGPHLRELRGTAPRDLCPLHDRLRRRGVRRGRGADRSRGQGYRRGREPVRLPTPGGPPVRATWAAGRWPAACSSSTS